MKRVGGLWQTLTGWPNLALALHRAALGKRGRPDVAQFLLDWEPRLVVLRRELEAGEYRTGGYMTFVVREPKARRISAAPFRDRVVHHALTQVLEPVFEPRFTRESCACRTGFGTHRALDTAARAAFAFPHVMQGDIRKYFPSIDHGILKGQLAGAVKCGRTLQLLATIIEGSNEQEAVSGVFPGDDLFTSLERRRGLPLGNQTSQFFANLYLNSFDHFVLREIRPRRYVRYVDDFLLFHEDKGFLKEARVRIEAHLDSLRLRLHDGKSRTYRTEDGFTFLGWRIFPEHRRLVRTNVVRFHRRMKAMWEDYRAGALELEKVVERLRAWDAHAAHGDTWRLREGIYQRYPFGPRGPE